MSTLDRFSAAQDHPRSGFEAALAEIQAGRKRGHWIWYIFPQLAGLGMSSTSRTYAIANVAEARDYLRDPVLRSRLITIATAVADQLARGTPIDRLMGSSLDAQKLVSSMTLFAEVARGLAATEGLAACAPLTELADGILDAAEGQGYPRCRFTMDALSR